MKIKSFDDYHDIIPPKGYKSIELGCFPPKNHWCFKYFGLFYKTRKPSVNKVFEELKKKVHFGEFYHGRTNEEIGITEQELFEEVSKALKNK